MVVKKLSAGDQIGPFIIPIGDGPHIAARIGMNRAGILALDLLSPVLSIR
jgi:hypothetical protein